MEKIVFLDRDGTINEEVNYLHRTEDLKFLPGVPEALRLLKEAGFKLVVVTNQAGVARGYYTCADVEHLHAYMNEELKKYGAEIDAFYYCPHHPVHGIGPYKFTGSVFIKRSASAESREPGCFCRQKNGSGLIRPIPTWSEISFWMWKRE